MISLMKKSSHQGESEFEIWKDSKPTGLMVMVTKEGHQKYDVWSDDLNTGLTEPVKTYKEAITEAKAMAERYFRV